MGPIVLTLLRVLLPWISGWLAHLASAKATAPGAFAAPFGLSSTGLYLAAAFAFGFWAASNPTLGINLFGRLNSAIQDWIHQAATKGSGK